MKKIRVALLISTLPILFGSAYYLVLLLLNDGPAISEISDKIDAAVRKAFAENEVEPSAVKRNYVKKEKGMSRWDQVEIVANVDEDISLAQFNERLKKELLIPSVTVDEQKKDFGTEIAFQLSVNYRGLTLYQILLKQRIVPPAAQEPEIQPESVDEKEDDRPRIALLVDDVGYDMERALELLNLRRPMTISIFPQLLYSKHVAEVAHKMGYEIMMHLPMEPGENLRRNPGFIMQSMQKDELFWILDRDLDSIPYVSGVNNHQGSKMTAEEDAMALVMEYLAAKNLYFIDSRTTTDSVAYEVAEKFGVKAAENDVFLDNEKDLQYIKERLEILIDKAQATGEAIGICHVHPVTIQALREVLPLVEQKGIKLVYASELVK